MGEDEKFSGCCLGDPGDPRALGLVSPGVDGDLGGLPGAGGVLELWHQLPPWPSSPALCWATRPFLPAPSPTADTNTGPARINLLSHSRHCFLRKAPPDLLSSSSPPSHAGTLQIKTQK